MSSIISLEWLLLVGFALIILLVGCSNLLTRPAQVISTPEKTPPTTLTVYPFGPPTLIPRSTLPPSGSHTATLANGLTLDISPPPLPAIDIQAPTCFASPNAGFLCLGQVHNRSDEQVTNLTLRVDLPPAAQAPPHSHTTTVHQAMIAPDTSAPYHIIFPSLDHRPHTITPQVSVYHIGNTANIATLTVVSERGFLAENGRYVITATLQNDTPSVLLRARVLGTVYDERKRVVGYRVIELDQDVSVGQQVITRMEVIPQVKNDRLTHSLTAQGHPKP